MHLTRLSYFGDFFLCPALVVLLAGWALADASAATAATWFGALLAGIMGWTLVEYVIHRSIYHRVQPFQGYHDAHHAKPNELIGAPSVIGVVLIVAVVFGPLLVFGFIVAGGATAGFLLGYFAYMMIHHGAHHWNIRPGSYLYGLRTHHARHHYAHEEGNFGVTTSLWDHVFGTALAPRRQRSAS